MAQSHQQSGHQGRRGQPAGRRVGRPRPTIRPRVFVRRWTGARLDGGVGGVGDGLVDTAPTASDVSLAPRGPAARSCAWGRGARDPRSSIFVRAWDGGSWVEIGTGSATGTGISGSPAHDFIPSIALDRAAIPTVACVDALGTEASGQHVRADVRLAAAARPDRDGDHRAGQRTSGPDDQRDQHRAQRRGRDVAGNPAPLLSHHQRAGLGRCPAWHPHDCCALAINGASTAATSLKIIPVSVDPGALPDPGDRGSRRGGRHERNERTTSGGVLTPMPGDALPPAGSLTVHRAESAGGRPRPGGLGHHAHRAQRRAGAGLGVRHDVLHRQRDAIGRTACCSARTRTLGALNWQPHEHR